MSAFCTKLLPRLAERLTAEFGRGFDASNLRYMRLFYGAFPNCDALRHELSWTHFRTLLRLDDPQARRLPIPSYGTVLRRLRAYDARISRGKRERPPRSQSTVQRKTQSTR
jgi:DUF1016 N-terminal domain